MSVGERDRLVVVRQVASGVLTGAEGARRLGLSARQMRRMMRGYEAEGDGVVIHGLRGRPSNRRLDEEIRRRAVELAGSKLYRDFGPTLLSEHLARDPEVGLVHPSTLRRWMVEAGLWTPRRRGVKHRRRRERRASYGELVLMDTSIHDWLEGRYEDPLVLIALIDDATSRLVCRFFPRDTGAANRRLLIQYLERHGRMGAVYADRAGHFQGNFRAKERREKDQERAITLIQRGLNALDIELIRALSPQAKGRVERLFGTLQDRLIKEMRVRGIGAMEDANRFLDEEFVPFWDRRFAVVPRESTDAHRPLPEGADLLRLFADTEERVIGHDFTVRFRNRFYQIEAHEAHSAMPRTRVVIEERLDGSLRFLWRDTYLLPTALMGAPLLPPPEPAPQPTGPRPLTGAAGKPVPPDHPWRRYGALRIPNLRTKTATPPSLSTPTPGG